MKTINLTVNGRNFELDVKDNEILLDTLRKRLNFTGAKEGCGEGECGACVVFFNGHLANSCLIPMANVMGKNIVTIEGFKTTKRFEVIENAFLAAGSVQCGFCIPGMIMATDYLLRTYKAPTLDEIKEGLSGNICRCTGYQMIFDAVMIAKEAGDGLW